MDRLLEADARDELAALPEPVRGDLARTQVRARRASYAGSFPAAVDWLILLDGSPVGRLLLDSGTVSLHIVDVRLEPAARGRGVGTEVLHDVCSEAALLRLDVTLSARAGSDAERWYRRNGFVDAAARGADEADVVLVRRADRGPG